MSLVNSAFRRQDLINNAKERERKKYRNAKFLRDIMTKLCKHQMMLLWNLLKFVIGEDKCEELLNDFSKEKQRMGKLKN